MNDLSIQPDQLIDASEPAAEPRLPQAGARSGSKPPRLPAQGLLYCEGVVGAALAAGAALPVHPNDRLNTIHQIIVCHVVSEIEGRHGVVL